MPLLSPNLKPYDKDNGQAGLLAPTGDGWLLTTLGAATNTARFARFVPSRTFTVASISFATQAFSAGDTADPVVDVGIYDSSLAKIVTSGAVSGKLNGAVGLKNVDITDTVLTAGTVYYAALAPGALGTTTATLVAASYATAGAARAFGSAAGFLEVGSAASSHPLPASLTDGGTAASAFAMWLIEA